VERKGRIVCLILALCVAGSAGAQGQTRNAELWWSVSPGAALPLGLNSTYFSPGAALGASAEYLPPSLGGLSFLFGLNFGYVPVSLSGVGGLLEAAPSIGAAFQVPLLVLQGLSGRLFTDIGYSYVGFLEHVSNSYLWYGGDAFAEAGAGLSYFITPALALRLNASYVYFYQLYGSLNLSLGVAFTTSRQPPGAAPGPARPRLLDISQVKLGSVFPVFHAFYDEHSVGTAVVKNTSAKDLSDIRVSFIIKQYMDGPKECATITRLAPGESQEVKLYALFSSTILEVTEPTKVTAEIDAAFKETDGSQDQTVETASLRVYDRNAMTWDDDRKAAAFVSAKDPWVLDLSNNATAMIKDLRNPGVVANLQTAIAFHDALRVYGLAYTPNPSTPYSYTSTHPEVVDFLKFPRQTLVYRAGDCSDLSILYASLFESVGVETAFITVPGHIFMAISLDMPPAEAKEKFAGSADLIFHDGKTWLPIETTIRDKGLLDAWHEAAREWREGVADQSAAFYPVHDAWNTYQPVGLAADATSPAIPASDLVTLAFSAELKHRVDDELAWTLAPLNQAIQSAPSPRAFNSRGVVYAKYGRLEPAESDFKAALAAKTDYVSALINLGNLATLRADDQSAYEYYSRAVKASPENPHALLALARTAEALGKSDEAGVAYANARKIDPQLAERSGAPGAEGAGGTRASAQGAHAVEWQEE